MEKTPRFEAGKSYGWDFYFTDNGGIWKCIKRTEKTVTIDRGNGKPERLKIRKDADRGEYVFAHSAFCYAESEEKDFHNPDWMD